MHTLKKLATLSLAATALLSVGASAQLVAPPANPQVGPCPMMQGQPVGPGQMPMGPGQMPGHMAGPMGTMSPQAMQDMRAEMASLREEMRLLREELQKGR